MNNKIIENEYTKIITKGVIIDMITEIMGCLDMIYIDAIDKDNMKLLHAHKQIFMHTVENELRDDDKVKVYKYAQKICMDILHERKYNKELRQIIHKWCGKLELRIRELEQKGYYALLKAHEKAKDILKEMIKKEYDNPSPEFVHNMYLVLLELEKRDR